MSRRQKIDSQAAPPKRTRRVDAQHLSIKNPLFAKTEAQRIFIEEWLSGVTCLVGAGSAGSGKTFAGLHLALKDLIDGKYCKILIVRSTVAVRDIGYLPGELHEKIAVYETPYKQIVNEILGCGTAYDQLKKAGLIEFQPTSFLRGTTYDNCIILIDEFQNMNDVSELRTVLTRVGENTRVICIGDTRQCDFIGKKEKSGFDWLIKVADRMSHRHIAVVNFFPEDIVRSGFVKSLLMADELV